MVAKEILNAVVALIETGGFTDVDIERQLVPRQPKNKLTRPLIAVCWNGKEGKEVDRVNEFLEYKVAVGIYYPVTSVMNAGQQDLVIDFVESVQDFIADRDNRELTLASQGTAELQLPFDTDQIFDPEEVRQTGCFFSVMNFNYYYYKGRS